MSDPTDTKSQHPSKASLPQDAALQACRLFGDRREVWIQRYGLRITRWGELLLQK
jgi:hemin uptake protein HemP